MSQHKKAAIIAAWQRRPDATIASIAAETSASMSYVSILRMTSGPVNPRHTYRAWTPQEIETMRTDYATLGPKRLARMFNRPYHSVERKAERMGVRAKSGGGRKG